MKYKVIAPDYATTFGFYDSIEEARGFIRGLMEGNKDYYGKYFCKSDFIIEEVKWQKEWEATYF